MNCDLISSIPDWIIEHPETVAVFERLGLDCSCGGKSLEYLCIKQDLSPGSVLRELEQAIRMPQANSDTKSRQGPGE